MTSKERAAGVGAPAAGEADCDAESCFNSDYTTNIILDQDVWLDAHHELSRALYGFDFACEPILEFLPSLPLDPDAAADDNRPLIRELLRERPEILQSIKEAEERDFEPVGRTPHALNDPPNSVGLQAIRECLDLGETGDAKLLAKMYEDRIIYDHTTPVKRSTGSWFYWNGQFWQQDHTEAVPNLVRDQVAACYLNASSEIRKSGGDKDLESRLISRANSLRQQSRVRRVLEIARGQRHPVDLTIQTPATPHERPGQRRWDSDPWLFPCLNATIDLKSGIATPGQPEHYLQTVAPTMWRGIDAPAPRWHQFLEEIFAKDYALISFVQRLYGYGITGLGVEHRLPMQVGGGRNGKDTLNGMIMEILGNFARPVADNVILRNPSNPSGPTPYIYALRYCRIAFINETREGASLNAEQAKRLTGGSEITARPMYGNPSVFLPRYLLVMSTNHRPRAASDDFALWQRLMVIPFTQEFVDHPTKDNQHKRDPYLKDKLRREASGILAWLVQGCLRWQREGLNPPDTVIESTDDYQSQEDVLGLFIDDVCLEKENLRVGANEFYQAYREWCGDNGLKPMSGLSFGKRMVNKYERKRSGPSGGRQYHGIGLLSDQEPEQEALEGIE